MPEVSEYGSAEEGQSSDLFTRLRKWVAADIRDTAAWRKEARIDFAFHAGDQWEEADRVRMRENKKPCVVFNRVAPTCQAVMGMEVSNRQEVKYIPRTTSSATAPGPVDPLTGQPAQQPIPGANDQGPAEMFTAAVQFLRDECDAEDEDTDAFQDTVICGMGWTETRIDYDEDPDGKLIVDRIDPLEMVWDAKSNKRNLIDSRRRARIREIDIEIAREMFPGFDNDQLHAGWASLGFDTADDHDRELARNYGNDTETSEKRGIVRIVEIEWCEKVSSYQVFDDTTGQTIDVDEDQFGELKKRLETLGRGAPPSRRITKMKYRRAFLGSDILEETPSQCQYGFKFQPITGYRDRNRRQWVGVVRAMRDPQRWANALLSSTLNQIMSAGKGIMAERGAFENDQQAESSLAVAEKITWMNAGALSGSAAKVMPKPQAQIPPGINDMMMFSMQSMRDVTGINVEVLGLADRDQAASLEYQRRQAATTILAPLFDGLRRYRKDQGRILMHLANEYLSDGRMVRIVGPAYEQYVPFVRDPSISKYDIIVDEAPSSPNQKEATWAVIQGLLPALMKLPMPMEVWGQVLKASPLPESTVIEITRTMQEAQAAQAQQPNPEEQKMQFELQKQQMDMAVKGQEMQLKQVEMGLKEKELMARAMELDATHQFERERMAHETGKQRMELTAQMDETAMQSLGASLPSQIGQIAESIGQLAQAVTANQQQLMTAMAMTAQSTQQLAAAVSQPKQLIFNESGMPTGIAPVTLN